MARVLHIGDVHEPVAHPGYLYFCQDLREKHKCDTVVFEGDVVDWHAISFHAKHPEAPGPTDEYKLAKAKIGLWYRVFRKATVCIGNHDARVIRVAEENGIPGEFIRTYSETWETPGWNWVDDIIIDDVYSFHGTGTTGVHPAFGVMGKMLMSVTMGHIHSAGGIKWKANPLKRIFGMDVGCGIDDRAYAFAYGKPQKTRSILSAGVVIDGIPHHEIMPIGPGEKYHRSRFAAGEENAKTVVSVPRFADPVGRDMPTRLPAGGGDSGNPGVPSADSRAGRPSAGRRQAGKRPSDDKAGAKPDQVHQRDRGKGRHPTK